MARAERSAKYGKIWKTSILGNPTIMVFEEEACRKVLKEEGRLVEVIWPDATAELVGCYIREASKASDALHGSLLQYCDLQRHAVAPLHQGSSPVQQIAALLLDLECYGANIISVYIVASMPC